MSKSVQSLVEDIRLVGEEQYQIVQKVRRIVKKTIQPLSEEVKYGGIMFSSEIAFSGVFAYKQHVSVEFSHGAMIDDADGFLEGAGKGRRHLKLRTLAELDSKRLAAYLVLGLEAARQAESL